jgi:hypothetical protein
LELITPLIQTKDTGMRRALTPHKQSKTTLSFLPTARNCENMQFSAAISQQAHEKVIPNTWTAIYMVLRN